MRKTWCFGLVAVAGLSCMPAALDPLPGDDRARFAQCLDALRARRCPELGANTGDPCSNDLAMAFAAESSPVTRRQWLVVNGCPRNIAEYYGRVPSAGGEAPAPPPVVTVGNGVLTDGRGISAMPPGPPAMDTGDAGAGASETADGGARMNTGPVYVPKPTAR
jgi:hypothetical protein